MKVEDSMLRFPNAEPIVEAKKVPTKYRYYISFISISNTLVRLDYDPDIMYVENGWWEIPEAPCYVDNVAYDVLNSRVSGIGFFESLDDTYPSIVINSDKQEIYILDKKHLEQLNNVMRDANTTYLIISFEQAFGDKINWDTLVANLKPARK